mgnify:CR=1 FL=1
MISCDDEMMGWDGMGWDNNEILWDDVMRWWAEMTRLDDAIRCDATMMAGPWCMPHQSDAMIPWWLVRGACHINQMGWYHDGWSVVHVTCYNGISLALKGICLADPKFWNSSCTVELRGMIMGWVGPAGNLTLWRLLWENPIYENPISVWAPKGRLVRDW